ncbi:MAG: hypothetical protein S0880_30465 [Actinomycetota bacterium]|nr:hypothetical protein [Actinomycetota bacterium]
MTRTVFMRALFGWLIVALLAYVVLLAAGVSGGVALAAAVLVGFFLGGGLGLLSAGGRLAGSRRP